LPFNKLRTTEATRATRLAINAIHAFLKNKERSVGEMKDENRFLNDSRLNARLRTWKEMKE
jgi:hypothetical protein